jgi:hypothetical protein
VLSAPSDPAWLAPPGPFRSTLTRPAEAGDAIKRAVMGPSHSFKDTSSLLETQLHDAQGSGSGNIRSRSSGPMRPAGRGTLVHSHRIIGAYASESTPRPAKVPHCR